MTIEDLKFTVEKFKESYSSATPKRDHWKSITCKLIEKTLKEIVAKYDLKGYVRSFSLYDNYSSITFEHNKLPSGIINKGTALVKYGGALIFHQSYNGNINVIVTFPQIEDVTLEMPAKVIQSLSPDKIDEETVVKAMADFLRMMTSWEDSGHDKIGFEVPKS